MRYIIVLKDKSTFYSPRFKFENHWGESIFFVIDVAAGLVSFGGNLTAIEFYHL